MPSLPRRGTRRRYNLRSSLPRDEDVTSDCDTESSEEESGSQPIAKKQYNLRNTPPKNYKEIDSRSEAETSDTDKEEKYSLHKARTRVGVEGDHNDIKRKKITNAPVEIVEREKPCYNRDETDTDRRCPKTLRQKGLQERSRMSQYRRPHGKKQGAKTGLLLLILILILILVFACPLSPYYLRGTASEMAETKDNFNVIPKSDRYDRLMKELERIKEKYPELKEEFWTVVAGSSWSHVNGDRPPERPVVLMLAGDATSELATLASDIAKLFSKTFTTSEKATVDIDGARYATKESNQAKFEIDSQLKDGFNNKTMKVALVHKFDKLPPCSVMLFHSYCDNDNAPYKDNVLLLTVQLSTTLPTAAGQKEREEMVQEHLSQLWAKCPEELFPDKIVAIHSRVSNNIVFVN